MSSFALTLTQQQIVEDREEARATIKSNRETIDDLRQTVAVYKRRNEIQKKKMIVLGRLVKITHEQIKRLAKKIPTIMISSNVDRLVLDIVDHYEEILAIWDEFTEAENKITAEKVAKAAAVKRRRLE